MRTAFLFLITAANLQLLLSKPFQLQNYDGTYKNMLDTLGNNYEFEYQTPAYKPEGLKIRKETGRIERTSSGEEVLRVHGTYEYYPECDHHISVEYWADENGFRTKRKDTFNRQYQKVNGRTLIIRICAAAPPPQIGAACLASLQGGCVG